jgi:hypothetical protein
MSILVIDASVAINQNMMAIDNAEHSPSTTRSVCVSPRFSSFQPHYSGSKAVTYAHRLT